MGEQMSERWTVAGEKTNGPSWARFPLPLRVSALWSSPPYKLSSTVGFLSLPRTHAHNVFHTFSNCYFIWVCWILAMVISESAVHSVLCKVPPSHHNLHSPHNLRSRLLNSAVPSDRWTIERNLCGNGVFPLAWWALWYSLIGILPLIPAAMQEAVLPDLCWHNIRILLKTIARWHHFVLTMLKSCRVLLLLLHVVHIVAFEKSKLLKSRCFRASLQSYF